MTRVKVKQLKITEADKTVYGQAAKSKQEGFILWRVLFSLPWIKDLTPTRAALFFEAVFHGCHALFVAPLGRGSML